MDKLLSHVPRSSENAASEPSSGARREWILLDEAHAPEHWQITSDDLGFTSDPPFSVSLRTLHGGRREGVTVIVIDTGAIRISVVPTRGMAVYEALLGQTRFGWDSPVNELVHPSFIDLNGRGGLGWLEGFNELVTRCGYEWVGAPGLDQGIMLSLHGRAANTPASKVVLSIDEQAPHTIRLQGELKEQAFKQANFLINTELSIAPGARSFKLHDTLMNRGDYPKEYQALYHSNFGPPILELGAQCSIPVRQVSPRDERAMAELKNWRSYQGPTQGYGETVLNVVPYADLQDNTLVVLHNATGDLGVCLGFNIRQLPVFSLWKNTDTLRHGYVTGLEPGTSFSYNRSEQRALHLVPVIKPTEERHFELHYSLLAGKDSVAAALKQVETIQDGRPTEVRETPLVTSTEK